MPANIFSKPVNISGHKREILALRVQVLIVRDADGARARLCPDYRESGQKWFQASFTRFAWENLLSPRGKHATELAGYRGLYAMPPRVPCGTRLCRCSDRTGKADSPRLLAITPSYLAFGVCRKSKVSVRRLGESDESMGNVRQPHFGPWAGREDLAVSRPTEVY
jgi:hypothetical protein